jgi:nucleotide-binding universal stress UspA family protein
LVEAPRQYANWGNSMNIRTVLVATDFSPAAADAVNRAAEIARSTGLSGVVAHVLPGTLPIDMQVQASIRAQEALSVVTNELQQSGLGFRPQLLTGEVATELSREASHFDLMLAGARGEDFLLDFAMGRTSVRLVRESKKPTLIVKRPAERPYTRVVAAIDFSACSDGVVDTTLSVAPGAQIDLVHAFEVEFESALRRGRVEEDKIDFYRNAARAKAASAMEEFAAGLSIPAAQCLRTVRRGYPPRVILDAADDHNAQLIVVGKHAAGFIERMFVGSVALQVLEMARCDVLIVPEERRS